MPLEENVSYSASSEYLQDQVFPKMAAGNTVLLLGAGASVMNDRKILSAELMEYHRAAKGFDFETHDITEYVDVLSKNPRFSRHDFDTQAAEYLRDLRPATMHESIVRVPWREIITTNYDLLVERAYDQLDGVRKECSIKTIRKAEEYRYNPAADEFRYVKLNGCVSDRSKFPLVFSSRDFDDAKPFYKLVLGSLEYLSPRTQLLAVGYSFRDPFAADLLRRFDRFNYRNRREIILVDPFVQKARVPALREDGIRVIGIQASDFFSSYDIWKDENAQNVLRRKRVVFKTASDKRVNIPADLSLRISSQIKQLGVSGAQHVDRQEFYRGGRPTYYVVEKGYDVVRKGVVEDIKSEVLRSFYAEEIVLPIVAISGSYGIGKSTLCYRVVHDILASEEDIVAFEVIDPVGVRKQDLQELLDRAETSNVILVFDECEVDSSYKALLRLQADISASQLSGINIVFLVPIRENILQRLKRKRRISSLNEYDCLGRLDREEAADFLAKLNESGLVRFADVSERQGLVEKVMRDYDGDPFVTLLSLVLEGQHSSILRDAYGQLGEMSKKAFLLTSLLYRYKIQMPASLLMKMISSDWESFQREVVEVDTKGVLVQCESDSRGADPDLFFRTRHSVVSEHLIQMLIPSPDEQYYQYDALVKKMVYSPYTSRLLVDLLKAIRLNDVLSESKVRRLYDACASEFIQDPHFNIHYAINLQYRGTEAALRKGIDRLLYVEGVLSRRNHRLTHRRAVLLFRLAQMILNEKGICGELSSLVDEARGLFSIKLIEDPFSVYSYFEFVRFELWSLDKISASDKQKAEGIARVIDLFEKARRTLHEGLDRLATIEAEFREKYQGSQVGGDGYDQFVEKLYQNVELRHYALILRYHWFSGQDLESVVEEMEGLAHLDEIIRILFRHYGKTLYRPNSRVKLLEIAGSSEQLLIQDPVGYHYLLSVAEAYNWRFQKSRTHSRQIRERFGYSLRRDEVWKDEEGNPEIFSGIPYKSRGRKRVEIPDMQQYFHVSRARVSKEIDWSGDSHCRVRLTFSTMGIYASLV